MDEKILFQEKQILIKDIGNGILEYEIFGFVNLNLTQLIDREVLSAIRKTRVQKIITDVSEMRVISSEAKEYNKKNIIPNWRKVGIKYNAVIMSSDVYGQFSTKSIIEKYKNSKGEIGFITKMFDNHKDALEWIIKQK